MRTASSTYYHRGCLAAGLLLLACGGSNPSPAGSSITVTGRLIDGFGKPLPGRTILVGGLSSNTDANGSFSASIVGTPYDVITLETSPTRRATVYAQLTRSDPQLVGWSDVPIERGTLGGQLVGGDPLPTPPGTRTGVCFSSPEGGSLDVVTSNPYAFQVLWYGPTSTTGNVRALQWTVDANGTVTGYRSHGVRTGVTLTADGTTSGVDVTLTPTLTGTVSGTLTIPDGYSLDWRDVDVTFAQGNSVPSFFPVSSDTVNSPSFSFPVPSGIGSKCNRQRQGQQRGRPDRGTGRWSRSREHRRSAHASRSSPDHLPAGWLDRHRHDDRLQLDAGGKCPLPRRRLREHDVLHLHRPHDTRLPDLTAQGFGLPPGYTYYWELSAGGPYASIDEFAAPGEASFEKSGFSTWVSANFTTR